MRRVVLIVVCLLSGALTSCGGDDDAGAGSGEERSVLVDFRHDEFAAAFLQYYPENLKVRPGDTVQFRQAWTGEPHSVTFGKVVDDFIEIFPKLQEFESPEAARAAGESEESINELLEIYGRFPAMTNGFEIAALGAEPCYVEDIDEAPVVRDVETDEVLLDAKCPTKGDEQPAFNGRQALYNSGFIPYSGERGNSFEVPIAEDAEPGTYQYFCNYHFIFMGGSVEVVEKGAAIPSQSEVSRQARKEIEADADRALKRVREAEDRRVGDKLRETVQGPEGELVNEVTLPLSGRATDEETPVIINEFFPRKVTARVNEKITWTFDGGIHTVSFNVPKYFPIFTVSDSGRVEWDPQAYEPEGWGLDYEPRSFGFDMPPPLPVDAGKWDGKGGFHSSGALLPGDSFSIAFTKAGTYPFACVLHPQMVGTLVVTT